MSGMSTISSSLLFFLFFWYNFIPPATPIPDKILVTATDIPITAPVPWELVSEGKIQLYESELYSKPCRHVHFIVSLLHSALTLQKH